MLWFSCGGLVCKREGRDPMIIQVFMAFGDGFDLTVSNED